MGIAVTCPHGHQFKVKDKYAGKRGLCPFCPGQVKVLVPSATSSQNLSQAAYRAAAQGHGPAASSVFDDHPAVADPTSSSSLLGSSVIRHDTKCQCGAKVPLWFARCPQCGNYLEHP